MNKLYLIRASGGLSCKWVQTGDPRMPLTCVWTGANASQTVSAVSSEREARSEVEAGGMHLCA
jgi:hypothetical protein